MARPSPAQIAARKKFAAAARAGTLGGGRKKKRTAAAAENPVRRRKKSKGRKKRRANPAVAASENPRRRRRKRRANPSPAANPRRRRRTKRRANPVAANPRRRRKSRRRSNPVTATRGITVHTHMHGGGAPVRDNPRRRRRRRANPHVKAYRRKSTVKAHNRKKARKSRRRRSNPVAMPYVPAHRGMLDNPSYSGLFENPIGPYSTSSLKAFGVASAGLALGLLVARAADRFIATMKPKASKNGKTSNLPWYGKNAVAAIYRRPDAIRLGVQAAGAVAGIGGAYMLRNKPIAPWALGGIALGFGSNLLLQLAEWYAIPYLLKIKDPGEKTMQNRLYVLEQIDTQDEVDKRFEDWASTPALMANQMQDPNAVVVQGPLNTAGSSDLLTLGRIAAERARQGSLGTPRKFVADGRVGHCGECGGDGGHYAGCAQCVVCNGGGVRGRRCLYTVERNTDPYAIAQAAGITIADIAALNGGGTPDQWWIVGSQVTLPEPACNVVISQGTPALPENPPVPVNVPTNEVPAPSLMSVAGHGESVPTNVAYALAGGQAE